MYKPLRNRRKEKAILRNLLFQGWTGVEDQSLTFAETRTIVRLVTTADWKYDCWVPDPDDEKCCVHLIINERDVVRRLMTRKDSVKLVSAMGCYFEEFKDFLMADKLYRLSKVIDLFDFFELEEVPEGVPVDEIKLARKITDDALEVVMLEDLL